VRSREISIVGSCVVVTGKLGAKVQPFRRGVSEGVAVRVARVEEEGKGREGKAEVECHWCHDME
jgi:hypothetical protein